VIIQGNAQVRQVYQPQPAGCCACCVVPSYGGLIAMSCWVFWCWGGLFGIIAFILAVVGQNQEASGQVSEGRNLAKASFWVSITGIIIGVAAVLGIGLGFGLTARYYYPYYYGTTCTYNYYGQQICNYG